MGKIQCIAKKVLEKVEVVGRSTSAVGRAVERVAIKLKDKSRLARLDIFHALLVGVS